jgi:hypothetical protein
MAKFHVDRTIDGKNFYVFCIYRGFKVIRSDQKRDDPQYAIVRQMKTIMHFRWSSDTREKQERIVVWVEETQRTDFLEEAKKLKLPFEEDIKKAA